MWAGFYKYVAPLALGNAASEQYQEPTPFESVPDVASKLKEATVKEKKFEDVVKEAEQAAVLVLVY